MRISDWSSDVCSSDLVLELFVRCRTQWPGNRIEEMYLPLTQEHIGDATGLTFVHVNRILRTLRKEGVVEFHHRRLRMLDPDRLVRRSEAHTSELQPLMRIPHATFCLKTNTHKRIYNNTHN